MFESCAKAKKTTTVLFVFAVLSLCLFYANLVKWYEKEMGTAQTAKMASRFAATVGRHIQKSQNQRQLHTGNNVCFGQNAGSIYFLETNISSTTLSGRKLCAFESAAAVNPDREVVVLLHQENMISENSFNKIKEMNLPNLHVVTTDFSSLVNSTPPVAKYWHGLGILCEPSLQHSVQASDLLRYAILKSCGGTYMDSDTVSIKPLPGDETLPNFVLEDVSVNFLNGAIMRFQKNSQFLQHILDYLNHYIPLERVGRNSFGPDLLRLVFAKHCRRSSRGARTPAVKWQCEDFSMLHKRYANPWRSAHWANEDEIDKDEMLRGIEDSFTIHYFGGALDDGRMSFTKKSPLYGVMAPRCPVAEKVLRMEVPD